MTLSSAPKKTDALRAASAQEAVWMRVGTLLDGTSPRPISQAHVVYDAEKIRYVGAMPPPGRSGEPDIDLPECTALPGLIDAHTHLFLEGHPVNAKVREENLKGSTEEQLGRARGRLERIVRLGIMAVRDAGDNRGIGLALREAQGPTAHLESPGPAIHHKGRYGSFIGRPLEDFPSAAACVEDRCRQGADRIKVVVSDIIDFKKGAVVKPPQMSAEEVQAISTAALAQGRTTFAHASGAEGVGNAIAGGVRSVEHGFFVTRDQLARMRDLGIAWVPTFAPVQIQIDRAGEMGWGPEIVDGLKRIIEGHAGSLRHACEIGVPIVAGSDAGSCGVPHGAGLLRELELMERAGMAPQAVVNAATGESAMRLRLREPVGRLAAGFQSRFILARHSPLETVRNLRRERFVIVDGQVWESNGESSCDGL